ncbi:MAG TPA: MipA/OmpV family protein [Sphingomonas sp.]|nr:MipA/OmpV family protein [Sphingomonas sp.]
MITERHLVRGIGAILALGAAFVGTAAAAQDGDAPRRTRVALGPQIVPSYPGADTLGIRPLIDVSRARGDEAFAFEAADESAGFGLWRQNGVSIGPAIGFEGSRTARNVGAPVKKVGFTVEAGAFVQYQPVESFRVRAEVRKGLGGHGGLIATLGADYIARDRDAWLVSLGPRITLADGRYNRSYFGVDAADAAATGLARFDASGGIQAVGATAGLIRQLTPRWGIYGFAKYDRLVADAARSPLVRAFGSRNQLSGGAALTYTFGGAKD